MFSPGDSPVWIYGDFPETDDDLHVMFGDQECTNVTLVDNETITCNSPAGMWSRLFFFFADQLVFRNWCCTNLCFSPKTRMLQTTCYIHLFWYEPPRCGSFTLIFSTNNLFDQSSKWTNSREHPTHHRRTQFWKLC